MSTTPSYTRDRSRDGSESRVVKHSHSWSENGRAPVPMWDSSDPDRAPPPLPLNPTANSPITKPNVSSNIEKAAALIASRALETAPSAYTTNPPPSPEKGIIRPHHRRMQTVQIGGSPNRISDSIERRSPDKGFRTSRLAEREDSSALRGLEESPTRAGSETPTPISRSSKLNGDENVPPTSGMLALQAVRNRQETESPFQDITNGSSRSQPPSFDLLSNQILNITNIATNLQREMSSLTKRSKDNASDLSKLQEATNSRDEDIRKTLRDLVSGLDHKFGNIDSRLLGAPEGIRSTPNLPLYLEDREHATPSRKSFTLPRIASPASFLERDITTSPSVVSVDGAASIAMLEKVLREMATKDGQDKLMTTLEKAKSEALATQMAQSTEKLTYDPAMMQKLEEIIVFMKDMRADSGSKALIRSSNTAEGARGISQMDIYLDSDNRSPKNASSEQVNEEVVKTLRSVKQSLSQHGGLTNEVKALVRELRGEVLGMGREIAKKLDETTPSTRDLQVVKSPNQDDVIQVVEQGMLELKEHMHAIVKENNMQVAQVSSPVDTSQVVAAVTQAMVQHQPQDTSRDFAAERDDMIVAIKEAWEECKPEISLEHFGLERDEILETLKAGFQSYQAQNSQAAEATYEKVIEVVQTSLSDYKFPEIQQSPHLTKEDVYAAVQQCLNNFDFPSSRGLLEDTSSNLSRDVVLDAIDAGMSKHATTTQTRSHLTKEEILGTLREGLVHQQPTTTKEVEFNRDDLFDAIKACLEGEQNPLGGMGERVVEAMHEFLGSMKTEFQQYSAASGRDTEQVLDALKDGLEDLRNEIESYVDRASDVTGKDEIIDAVKAGFAAMQADMDKGFTTRNAQPLDTPELLDAMEKEFEHLRESIRKSLSGSDSSAHKNEILDAIRDISDDRGSVLSGNSEDAIRSVKEELEHMRTTLANTLIKSAAGPDRDEILETIREGIETSRSLPRGDGNESIFSNTSELLDAFQDGVDNIRADMQKLVGDRQQPNHSQELLDSLNAGIENIRSDIESLSKKRDESDNGTVRGNEVMLHDENGLTTQIESLKVMVTQLRIKIEAMDMPAPDVNIPSEMRVHQDDLDSIHAALSQHAQKGDIQGIANSIREVQSSLNSLPRELPEFTMPEISIPEVVMPPNAACKEDIDALETLLHNMKAKLDEVATPNMESIARVSHIEALEESFNALKSSLAEASPRSSGTSSREDFTMVELALKDLTTNIESLHDKLPTAGDESETKLTKTDLEVLESLCLDMKSKLDEQITPDAENMVTKDDLTEIRENLKSFRDQFESDNDLTAQAFEARKIEHGGLATKIDDVRGLVATIREEVMNKLNSGEENVGELSRVLGMHHDNMDNYATASSINELGDLVTKAFDAFMESKSAGKTDDDERDATLFAKVDDNHQELRLKLDEKFEEFLCKYDAAQALSDATIAAMDERNKDHAETNSAVKDVVGELKGLIGSLGTTVGETCDKMANDSKTIFDVVDQSNSKLEVITTTNAHEHSLTREEIARTFDATTRLEGSLREQHPAILAAIKEVLEKVGQHFDHSQKQSERLCEATEEIKSGVRDIPSAIPALLPALPAVESAPSVVSEPSVRDVYDDTEMKGKLEELIANQYNDTEVHSKLDELMAHTAMAKEAFATMDTHHANTIERLTGLEKLDNIHDQVSMTADEIRSMVATQVKLMTEHQESRAEEAREAAIALEKRNAQKERVEGEIIALTDEKNALIDSMAALKREHEELFAQTRRLTKDVTKLETSLAIRQEELRDMNARAETLERRVLEGVLNHARIIKVAKGAPKKKTTPAERDASMNLRRVSNVTASDNPKPISRTPTQAGNAIGMALKKRVPVGLGQNMNGAHRQSTADRRILSTSHVQNGQTKGAPRAMILAPSNNTGLANLHRSQSVKSNPSTYLSGRKPSWTGVESSIADKENQSTVGDESFDSSSDGDTERRTISGGTSYMYTDSTLSRDVRRRTSYASSMGNTANGHNQESILEEDEEDEHDEDFEHNVDDLTYPTPRSNAIVLAEPRNDHNSDVDDDSGDENFEDADTVGDLPAHSDIVVHESKYAAPSDSGLGSEPPTPDQSTKAWRSTIST